MTSSLSRSFRFRKSFEWIGRCGLRCPHIVSPELPYPRVGQRIVTARDSGEVCRSGTSGSHPRLSAPRPVTVSETAVWPHVLPLFPAGRGSIGHTSYSNASSAKSPVWGRESGLSTRHDPACRVRTAGGWWPAVLRRRVHRSSAIEAGSIWLTNRRKARSPRRSPWDLHIADQHAVLPRASSFESPRSMSAGPSSTGPRSATCAILVQRIAHVPLLSLRFV